MKKSKLRKCIAQADTISNVEAWEVQPDAYQIRVVLLTSGAETVNDCWLTTEAKTRRTFTTLEGVRTFLVAISVRHFHVYLAARG